MPMLPDLNRESWKYSNVNAALKKLEVAAAAPLWDISGADAFLQVTDNGHVHITIPAGTRVGIPIQLTLCAQQGQELHSHVHIDIGAGAEVTILERQSGDGAYWKNITSSITLMDNASCHYTRMGDDAAEAVITANNVIHLARYARFHLVNVHGGAGFARNEYHVQMDGEGAEADMAGLSILHGKQHSDTTIVVNHHVPHGRSSQYFKHILHDQSRGVFQGKIHVHKDAQKTDGYQLSKNLLLSNLAEMDVKPELEIYADDVKCSHGTTTGQLDETPLFYLMSRGISPDDARRLLLEAFAAEIVDKVADETIRAEIAQKVASWLI